MAHSQSCSQTNNFEENSAEDYSRLQSTMNRIIMSRFRLQLNSDWLMKRCSAYRTHANELHVFVIC